MNAEKQKPAAVRPLGETISELDMSALSGRFGYNLRRAHAAVLNHLAGAFEEFDIRPRQYGILLTVLGNPGAIQGQVAQALGIARTNFVPMIDKLEERGLLTRKRSAADRRLYTLHLTEAGVALCKQLRAADLRHEQAIRATLGREDSEQLIRILRKIRRDLHSG